mmetsp:Transcript_13772/g.9932  ORF Transcript_13772/g.9932 Transcript_13772/m.9932 type:complete len:85 (+) Transcript_13772:187-441(+)
MSLQVITVRAFWNDTPDGSVYTFEPGMIPLQRCTNDTFNGDQKYLDKVGVVGNYFCPSRKDLMLQGGTSSEEFSFFSINVKECS